MANHLMNVLPQMLLHLRDTTHGCPSELSDDSDEDIPDPGFVRWQEILTEMAAGFSADVDGVPDEYVTELETSTGIAAQLGYKDREYDWDSIKAYQAAERAKLDNSLDLLKYWFRNLWD